MTPEKQEEYARLASEMCACGHSRLVHSNTITGTALWDGRCNVGFGNSACPCVRFAPYLQPEEESQLTLAQRAFRAAKLATWTRNNPVGPTRAQMAERMKLNQSRISDASIILAQGCRELIEAAEASRIGLQPAVRIAQGIAKEAQPAAVVNLLQAALNGRRHRTSAVLGVLPKEKRLPRFSDEKQMENTLDSLRVCLTVLERVSSLPTTDREKGLAWAKQLREMRTGMSQAIRALEGESHGQ